MERLVGAILLDAENLFCQMEEDLPLQCHPLSSRVCALAAALDKIALENGVFVQRRFTALAFHPRAEEHANTVARFLIERGYSEVAWVRPTPNAADLWLLEKAKAMIHSNQFDFFLLATGDTKEPFPTIVRTLTENGKRVHIVPYNRLASQNGSHLISSSILRPYLERALLEKPSTSSLSAEETFSLKLQQAVVWFRESPDNPLIPAHHRVWIERIIGRTVGVCSDPFSNPHVNFLYLEEKVGEMRWRGVQRPSPEAIRTILRALIRFTDLFEHRNCLQFNHQSRTAAIA